MKNIFFPEEKLQFIKSCEDERCRSLFDKAMKQAKKALELTPIDEKSVQVDGEGYAIQHENYGDAAGPFTGNMPFLAFAYEITGEEEYFLKAKELMLKYCSYSRWHGKGSIGKGELITGHFLTGMSYGWAAFSHKFTKEEKDFIGERIYTLGIKAQFEDWIFPETKIHCFDTMGHNWWPVCVSSGALAAVTMSDYLPDGRALARLAADGLRQWFAYKGNPINMKPATLDNGAFYEGVNYYNYALFEYLRFAEAFIMVTGEAPFDDKEIIRQSALFFVNTFYPSTEKDYVVGFGDSDGEQCPASVPLMLSRYPELAVLRFLMNRRTHSEDSDILIRLLNFREIYLLPEEEPTSLSVCYKNIGWAVFRDSFENNANMLAVKCGDSWNHSHNDASHFIFYKNGIPEIFDSQRCLYGNDIYREYFVQSKAHNVVLWNGEGQCPDDHHHHVRPKGELHNFIDKGDFRYVCADASGPMGKNLRKHLRHFIWIKDIIFIFDDLWGYEKGEANFLLHAEENNSFKMLTPSEKRTENGYLTHEITEVTFTSFNRNSDDYGRVQFLSAICLDDSKAPVFTELQNGYKVTYGDITAYFNLLADNRVMHRNCFNTFDGVTTDALVLIETGGEYAVVNGSSVRKDGKSIFDTYERITDKIN